ncbi:MAG TPA: hypothetical protein P5119_06370 [Candidatus Aminicenantes bacterium]|nr:hypothetical protein [Candidatus Aminicenantes bacterium]HRY64951.1 hypothetical protein [Candidatus Aminicenantes bacterium]HRZ71864.1 hypothetical protein [Candidatus Aminicenantes bacterium]
MSSLVYACAVCGHRVTVGKGEPIPLCCRKEMEPLPFCTTAPHPEMARNADEDEPCDNGTLARPGTGPAGPKK